MDFFSVFFYISIVAGALMAFSMGANDAANAMASAVGAKALNVRQAVIIAGLMNFIGSVFLGAGVTMTIVRKVVDADAIHDPKILTLGFFAALLTAGVWILISTLTGFPVSSTHAIMGAMVGFGLLQGGVEVVYWHKLIFVALSWVVSPILGALIAAAMYLFIRTFILKRARVGQAARIWIPFTVGLAGIIVSYMFIFGSSVGEKTLAPLRDEPHVGVAVMVGVAFCFALVAWIGIRRFFPPGEAPEDESMPKKIYRVLQAMTSAFVAMSCGANDVANAFGPVVAIAFMSTAVDHMLPGPDDPAPSATHLLVMGGFCIALGIALLGYRVIRTVGSQITALDNPKGFSVDFSVASVVLMASKLGIPVSSTTVAVGGVTGVGVVEGGAKAVDVKMLGKIFGVWVITLPVAGVTCCVIFAILKAAFL